MEIVEDKIEDYKNFLYRKVIELKDETLRYGDVLTEWDIKTILYSLPNKDENYRLHQTLEIDFYIKKIPLYKEIYLLLSDRTSGYPGQTPESTKRAEEWAIKLAEDYVGCSALFRSYSSRAVADCIIDRIAKRTGLRERIPEEFDFEPKEILRLML